jgi:short-subunit dehydrogenase
MFNPQDTVVITGCDAGFGAMGPLLDVPDMVARRQGMIVNISSISGVSPTPFAPPYCSSKAAVNAMSDSLRMELRPFGISVVTVQPGGIQSTFGESAGNQVSLQPDSPFQPVRAGIMDRAQEGQKNAMPAEEFAQRRAQALMARNCPAVLGLGEKSRLLPVLKRALPDRVLDRLSRP